MSSIRDLRVLVVVDDYLTVEEVKARIEESGNIVIAEVATGFEAIEEFRRDKPDLVIVDELIPGMSGAETAKMLKRESPVPVIMLKDRFLDIPCQLYEDVDQIIDDPTDLRELERALEAIFRQNGSGKETDDPFRLNWNDVLSEQMLMIKELRREVMERMAVFDEFMEVFQDGRGGKQQLKRDFEGGGEFESHRLATDTSSIPAA